MDSHRQSEFDGRSVNISVMSSCPDCGKHFSRVYNMQRHKKIMHSDILASDNEDVEQTVSDEEIQSDEDDQSGSEQSDGESEDEGYNIWEDISHNVWDNTIGEMYEKRMEGLIDEGMDRKEAKSKAYSEVLPKFRRSTERQYAKIVWK